KRFLKYWEGKKTLWLELKPSNLNGIQKKHFVQKVLNIVGTRSSNIHFISFDFSILKEIRKISPYSCFYLNDDLSPHKLFLNEIYGVDAEYIRYFKEDNLMSEITKF